MLSQRCAGSVTSTCSAKIQGAAPCSSFEGGFTLRYFLHEGKPNRYRPELRIKTIDSKRALKQFSAPHDIEDSERDAEGLPFRGHLLDLRTTGFALTDRGHTLESACEAFGVPYQKREVEHGQEYFTFGHRDSLVQRWGSHFSRVL